MLRFFMPFAAAAMCAGAMPASAGVDVEKYKAACQREYAESPAIGEACVIRALNEEADRVNQLADETWKQVENVRRNTQCLQFLLDGVSEQRFTREQVRSAYGAPFSEEIVKRKSCDAVRALGY